jgi:alkylation response protein AidB-like acyl-CoA dehydrogenase
MLPAHQKTCACQEIGCKEATMDFRFSEEEEAFRSEVREFLRKEWTLTDCDLDNLDHWNAAKELEKKLGSKGWLCMAWPKEYGGLGASHMHQLVFQEEMASAHAPIVNRQGVYMVGPCLMLNGTEEQKQRFLPPIANSQVVWVQGFSEPNAGSDLANLQTRAVLDGDDYVVNGQKTWCTRADRGDWIHLMVRTDPSAPKHRGISYLMADMRSPGISINPMIQMTGRADFLEVFFDNVRVPKANLVGPENEGWRVALTTLAFERSAIGAIVTQTRQVLQDLVHFARETKRNGQPLIEDPVIGRKLGELAIETEVAQLLSHRIVWMASRGQVPNYEASVAKTFTTELEQRIANFGMHLLGLYGQLAEGSKWAALEGRIQYEYLWTVGVTIYAGSNEIQRNIIATRGLDLPRG